ncbi:O-methyltransferase family 3 [Denitrovibrio acetiphilus DSM 12809]|jgi:predicted O-methyltransferase YrrM|uniref:O-methyltransferase family 3 n=1 Tax=Denitrovibrio acetiphilus (strain DSM 12809 / NBRC 114555 / N2460) TaxID=522772 RepID=D4H347_DENA2|nr:methyltransferase domain-containing protein [Denitrovibrio acetiphilus]ADD69070.1 O-methyltransferase family 3 [Denitrovibrio acetiphilus DSM 12809]
MNNRLLNPYLRGLADGADKALHYDAEQMKTPSVEPDTGMFLEHFAYSLKPSRILELGCGVGVSTRYMAKGAPSAHITAVDYNKSRLDYAESRCAGLNTRFVNSDVIKFLKTNTETYDMIFVDSMKKQYPIVFYHAYKLLNQGGSIIFDDIFVYGEVFCEDCEIAPKYINVVKTMRNFMNHIKYTHSHSFLPIGGGLLLVRK